MVLRILPLYFFYRDQSNDIQHNDTQHNGLICDTQDNDTQLKSIKCHYAKCRYAECCCAECRGAFKTLLFIGFLINFLLFPLMSNQLLTNPGAPALAPNDMCPNGIKTRDRIVHSIDCFAQCYKL
jgi:hypothetical protein